MIPIKCDTPTKFTLSKFTPFQGDLKRRKEEDIKALADSLNKEGLLMPFAIWQHEDKNYLLDGHGRMSALVHLALTSPDILQQEFPCILVEADTEENARKALLQITSTYGHINPNGVVSFAGDIHDYHAPVLVKATKKVVKSEKKVVDGPKKSGRTIIRLSVADEDVEKVKEILSRADYIKVL